MKKNLEEQVKTDDVQDEKYDSKSESNIGLKIVIGVSIGIGVILVLGIILVIASYVLLSANNVKSVSTVAVSTTTQSVTPVPTATISVIIGDGETAEDKSEYKELNDNHIMWLEEDKEYIIDLNGDGTEEKVKHEVKEYTGYLYINDELQIETEMDGEVNLANFDNSDGCYELSVFYSGTNDDPYTEVYMWDGKEIKLIRGFACDIEESITFNKDGKSGMIAYSERKDILGCPYVKVNAEYDAESGKVIDNNEGTYEVSDYGRPLKEDMIVYLENDMNSEQITIKAQDVTIKKLVFEGNIADVQFGDTYWLYIEAEDGNSGWFEVTHAEPEGEESIGKPMINGKDGYTYFDFY